MLRKLFVALVILALVPMPVQAVDQQFVYKNAALAATSVTVNFTTASGGTINAKYVKVQNLSATAVDVCVNWTGEAAAVCATDWQIAQNASETLDSPNLRTAKVSVICSAAGPCTVRILALN